MRWGLVPGWWKKTAREMPATFNARRNLSPTSRCSATRSEPPLHHPGERLLRMDRRERRQAAASLHRGRRLARSRPSPALWDRWRDPASGDECCPARSSCAARAHGWSRYHDRMPVILEPKDFDGWLRGSLGPVALACAANSPCAPGRYRRGSTAPASLMMIRPSSHRRPPDAFAPAPGI